MKKDRGQTSFANTGASSLLIVFLILCLTTFAILSLSSAKSDYSLSERLAAHKGLYYEASSEAENVLGSVDETLETIAAENSIEASAAFLSTSYAREVEQALNNLRISETVLSCKPQGEKLVISYAIPLEKGQALDVALTVTDFTRHEAYYVIEKWQIISTGTWEGDDSLNLMPVEKES